MRFESRSSRIWSRNFYDSTIDSGPYQMDPLAEIGNLLIRGILAEFNLTNLRYFFFISSFLSLSLSLSSPHIISCLLTSEQPERGSPLHHSFIWQQRRHLFFHNVGQSSNLSSLTSSTTSLGLLSEWPPYFIHRLVANPAISTDEFNLGTWPNQGTWCNG